jgi:hypothetical protein
MTRARRRIIRESQSEADVIMGLAVENPRECVSRFLADRTISEVYASAQEGEYRRVPRSTIQRFQNYQAAIQWIGDTLGEHVPGISQATKVCETIAEALKRQRFDEYSPSGNRQRGEMPEQYVVIYSGGLPGSGKRS